jgi:predicted GH43/DUF377 family glycosyl hydrolase
MVRPTTPDLKVVGVFNPGVAQHDGATVLLLRVAEAPAAITSGEVASPMYDTHTGKIQIKRWSHDSPRLDVSDPRVIVDNGHVWLTSISHLRVARSSDGIHFNVEPLPALSPATHYESYGIEDPRVTLLGTTYWINYSAVSAHGIATALASTKDFRSFERHGLIFPPPNRDVTIFPDKIDGHYVALHRPMPEGIGAPAIWLATSPDLNAWGNHRVVATARPGCWDNAKVGAGAVPFRVRYENRDAWLLVYHGVKDSPLIYSLGALVLDARDPARVLGRSREPILSPEASYEREGFFGGVVFTCGVVSNADLVRIYYGAADGVTAVADLSLEDILDGLEPQ